MMGKYVLGKEEGTLQKKRWDCMDIRWIQSRCSRELMDGFGAMRMRNWVTSEEVRGSLGGTSTCLAVPEGLQDVSPDISSSVV